MLKPSRAPKLQKLIPILWVSLSIGLAACTGSPDPATNTAAPTTAQAQTAAAPSQTVAPATTAPPASEGQLRLVLASEGNEARYRVREQLANLAFPSDAIGATSAVSGLIVLAEDGAILREESKFLVDLTTLRSDNNRRDNFIQRNTLQTGSYPTAEFVPTEALGLLSPLPTTGEVKFQLVGELTVHGVTHVVTWEVTAQAVDGRALTGSAVTSVTFGDFGMTAPQVPVVLSVQETIGLELDFHLILDGSTSP
jgi:polyisoprenoid-binding protein YceI